MGCSYWFECSRCGFRAQVAGRSDRGHDFYVQTILCRNCRALYDAVTRIRLPLQPAGSLGVNNKRSPRANSSATLRSPARPPSFQAALNRLPHTGLQRFTWVRFKLECPASPLHRVEPWSDPGECPRCGLHLEKNALPFRVWD